jgi:hypothetical protein
MTASREVCQCGHIHHDEPSLNLVYCEGPTCECTQFVPTPSEPSP